MATGRLVAGQIRLDHEWSDRLSLKGKSREKLVSRRRFSCEIQNLKSNPFDRENDDFRYQITDSYCKQHCQSMPC